MADTTPKEAIDALITAIKTITVANGYSTEVNPARVYDCLDNEVIQLKKDADYPKIFVLLDDAFPDQMVSEQTEEVLNFLIVFVTKKLNPRDDSPQTKVLAFIEDVRNMLRRNHTLGGVVNNAERGPYSTDAGYAHPEGAALINVVVRYYTGQG